ncbi:MAG TPA: diaminopimelate decarboxylase [Gemmatimonadaceae bacterium]|nr:diaminopimelate decarboxylase [Gemmatimonadaceae bacterium]
MGESVLTASGFARTASGELVCEGVSLEAIADAVGTPVYVYSSRAIREQYDALDRALAPVPHRLHYSMKANSNLAVLRLLQERGAGLDIVSGGELFRARKAGFSADSIVFSGVGKSVQELREALAAGILMFNVESIFELEQLNEVATGMGVRAPVALRVNPEVRVDTPHHYTRTGERGNKFGIPIDEALGAAQRALAMPNLALRGLDMHIGSQVSRLEPYRDGLERLLALHAQMRAIGASDLRYLDIGGGFAVTYEDETPMDLDALAAALLPKIEKSGLSLIVEPGRFIVGNAGVLLARVMHRKKSGGKEYIISDAGMNDLVRPSHYDAYHAVEAVHARDTRSVVDVVGPVCESGDFFALDREVDDVEAGDLIVVRTTGAYGYVMSFNYNARPRVAEVLVDGDRFAVATRRENYEDLVRLEPQQLEWRTD